MYIRFKISGCGDVTYALYKVLICLVYNLTKKNN